MSDAARAKQLFEKPAKTMERLARKERVHREVTDLTRLRDASGDLGRAVLKMQGLPESEVRGVVRNLARTAPDLASKLSAAFGQLAKLPSKAEDGEAKVEQAIVSTLSANPAVDMVFLRNERSGEVAAYLSVHRHSLELHEFAVNAESVLTESVGVPVIVRVWAHQGRDPLTSAPPDARPIFRRKAV